VTDEIRVTFTWAEVEALIFLLDTNKTRSERGPLTSAWIKLADAHQANDPPGRTYR
jgi:hypothetical protein